ncbi:proton-conducting transporter membrane subunit [Geopsychrobacter electrodiphilus]|uniref:proton-conducting transporter transmembrane domain-containing protein n=1 Tax=Geopsychrobacter electrodiphilus TaxID=225196 RepID=UPI0003637104|nr:proton-conducting transporter membrane subunit [Geopsychrobacter electrodiphilus]
MTLFITALLILLVGSLLSIAARKSSLATLIGTLSAVSATLISGYIALQVLLSGQALSYSALWSVPGGAFTLRLDPLAAFFVLPISIITLCCALYAGPYLAHEGQQRPLAPHWFFFNIMAIAMLLVTTAANALLFLAAWEAMTISSFFLVAWDHHLEEVRKAAWLYLLAAHLGMMLLVAMFILAGSYCPSLDFSDFGPLAQLPLGMASLLYLLALFGFGVKAGLFPIHIWLPNAHPAAPSHVSALMSGVLIKTGIYGILRVISFLPPAPIWWGWLMALLGAGGALYGISLAAQQRDIKRCLAYSTVENIGIMFLGLGFGLVAAAEGHPTLALFAYAGGMLHLWNHALFKGVMFLGAGTLLHATGTRDMNMMGGLLKRMPLAGLLWIGGSLAIGALPPLNGLVSEWLIYIGLAKAGSALGGFAALMPLLLFGLLGLVGALALVTFSRLIGICLLGEPRTAAAAHAHEAAPRMLLAMAALLAGCLTIGLYPQGALRLLTPALAQVSGVTVGPELALAVAPLGHWGLLLLLGLGVFTGVLVLLRNLRPQAQAATWACAFRFPTPRMAYTGEGFSELAAWHLLPKIMRPELHVKNVSGVFPEEGHLSQTSPDPVLIRILNPLFVALADRCQRLRWLQQGKLSIYLVYIFIASAVLMAWSLWAGGQGGG